MPKMICDHTEICKGSCMFHSVPHKKIFGCGKRCQSYPDAKCIPYINPILKRVQERFTEWAEKRTRETQDSLTEPSIHAGFCMESVAVLEVIIMEESEK